MINHNGGHVIFGIEPDGRFVGQHVTDGTLEDVAQELRGIEPPVLPTIERIVVGEGREVIVVSVGIGHSQPFTHPGQGYRRVRFLDNRQFHGNAFSLFQRAQRLLLDHMPIAGRFEQGRMERVDEPEYSPLAFREAIANVICHRDYASGGSSIGVAMYDDRLEVTSSGTLHFGFTPQSLFLAHESRPWNPLIASVLRRNSQNGPLKS
jgi:predicted HTH transcriptional regulator